MIRVNAVVALVSLLSVSLAQGVRTSDLSGDWTLASATTNRTRDGATGEQSTKTYLTEGHAFNCGRGCRILHKNDTLTIENAQLKATPTASSPTVVIPIDGKSHNVVDSITIPAKTIDAVARWEDGKLLITSMVVGIPMLQTIALEQGQLVIVKAYVTDPSVKLTLRYARK